jgi:hypothetical protein
MLVTAPIQSGARGGLGALLLAVRQFWGTSLAVLSVLLFGRLILSALGFVFPFRVHWLLLVLEIKSLRHPALD